MTVVYAEQPRPPHPVALDVAYPERLSRLSTFFRLILAIPQVIVVYLLLIVLYVLTFISWFGVLFTGRYPKAWFEFTSGTLRWQANLYAYVALLRDEYPPWSLDRRQYPLALEIPYAERQSRFRLFIRLIALTPNYIVFYFVQLAWFFVTFIAWFAILFTGTYPRGLHKFSVGALRWHFRSNAYLFLLRDDYPPYSINANARPGNEVVSAIIGLPLFAGYVALNLLPFFGLLGGGSTNVLVSRTALTSSGGLAHERPAATAGGVRVTLLGYQDDAFVPSGVKVKPGYHMVSFRVRAERDSYWPAFYLSAFFGLRDCLGNRYAIDGNASGIHVKFFWTGGSRTDTIYFQIPKNDSVCRLDYSSGRGRLRFLFQ